VLEAAAPSAFGQTATTEPAGAGGTAVISSVQCTLVGAGDHVTWTAWPAATVAKGSSGNVEEKDLARNAIVAPWGAVTTEPCWGSVKVTIGLCWSTGDRRHP